MIDKVKLFEEFDNDERIIDENPHGDPQEIIEELSKAIKDFLRANGGMSNGYETIVDGYVKYNVMAGSIQKLKTPAFRDLTGRQVDDKRRELEGILRDIVTKHRSKDTYKIFSSDVEDGCYNIYIDYTIRKRVYLW
jgi:hypothetical protein